MLGEEGADDRPAATRCIRYTLTSALIISRGLTCENRELGDSCTMIGGRGAARREARQEAMAVRDLMHGNIAGAMRHQERADQIHHRREVRQEVAAIRDLSHGNLLGAMAHSAAANHLHNTGPNLHGLGHHRQPVASAVAIGAVAAANASSRTVTQAFTPAAAYAPPTGQALMTVVAPPGVGAGQQFQVTTPDGQIMIVAMPVGICQGQQFQVAYMARPVQAASAPAYPGYAQAASPYAPAAPRSQATMTVVVPPGAYAGQHVQITTPDGQIMGVTVPAGVGAGQVFPVTYMLR